MNTHNHPIARPRKTLLRFVFAGVLLANVNAALADVKADADTILNWAEQTFPSVLPSHPVTQNFDKWWYREYLSTDLYAGINSQDNGVYYISGSALRNGENPIFFDTVANALKQATATPTAKTACNAAKLPAGHTVTQSGGVVKVTTNGCIAEPLDDPDYCPQESAADGISVLSRMDVTSTANGNSDTLNIVACTKNVAPSTSVTTVELDLCYNSNNQPPVANKIQGKIVYEKVADCFATDAAFVTDIHNDQFFFNTGTNGFVQFRKLLSR